MGVNLNKLLKIKRYSLSPVGA